MSASSKVTAKGVQVTNIRQVFDEIFFQHFPCMVNAYWHMNLNCGASNRIELKAKRTVVVTGAWSWDMFASARADKTTRLLAVSVRALSL